MGIEFGDGIGVDEGKGVWVAVGVGDGSGAFLQVDRTADPKQKSTCKATGLI